VRRLHAVVHGDVQGVGFRWFLVDSARPLGLCGWVRNLPDGSVEVTAEGEPVELDSLLTAARRGPHGARVTDVDIEWGEARGDLGSFGITH
jgi:acylphosphatase